MTTLSPLAMAFMMLMHSVTVWTAFPPQHEFILSWVEFAVAGRYTWISPCSCKVEEFDIKGDKLNYVEFTMKQGDKIEIVVAKDEYLALVPVEKIK